MNRHQVNRRKEWPGLTICGRPWPEEDERQFTRTDLNDGGV